MSILFVYEREPTFLENSTVESFRSIGYEVVESAGFEDALSTLKDQDNLKIDGVVVFPYVVSEESHGMSWKNFLLVVKSEYTYLPKTGVTLTVLSDLDDVKKFCHDNYISFMCVPFLILDLEAKIHSQKGCAA